MKKKVAVIGYGGMGGWHCEHLQNSDVAELAGIYDIKEERRELARSRGIRAYESFEEVLADPEVDILTLAIPNDCHKEDAILGLRAGKNVISEKPVTLSSADLQEMIDAANETGKLFTVHQNRRWDADFLSMKEIYESGSLGPVFNIESRVHGSRGIPGDWRQLPEHGGGMMLDWGVHLIDQILQMIPEKIRTVYAVMDHVTNELVDDGFKLDIRFDSGLLVRVEVGTSNFINLPRWYMQGRDGTAIIYDWDLSGKIVRCENWDEKDVVPVVTAAGLTKTMAPRDESTIAEHDVPKPNPDVHDFYRNVCKAIDGLEPQLVTHPQMMRVMKLMEAAFESDRQGQVIPFTYDQN
ncbi:MAG TPA: Gfo/Idh/MocA family oxidoreductase [Candidatus Merdivicinus faecavium]|nr:Gfo/Idh/MocA family oxidoreductase [Candidatus Merdivicinus faecavium]